MKKLIIASIVALIAFCLVGCDNEPAKTDKDYYNEYINLESTKAFINDMNTAYNDCVDAYRTDDLQSTKENQEKVAAIAEQVISNEDVPEVCEDLNRYAKRACENMVDATDYMVKSVEANNAGNMQESLDMTQQALSAHNLALQDVDTFNKEHEDLKLKYED